MKVDLLVIFLFGILNAFALTVQHEEGSKESSDQAPNFFEKTDEGYGLRTKLANRIIRGQEAKKRRFPWSGSFRYNGSHYCGGSFIGDRYVLTAAKCLNFKQIATGPLNGWMHGPKNNSKRYMSHLFEVVLGDHYLNTAEPSEEQKFAIADFISLQPVTNRSGVGLRNDVAVVKLDRPPKLTNYVSAIRLAKSSMGVSPGDELTFAGWGLSKRPHRDLKLGIAVFPEEFSNVLKEAQTTVIENEKCGNTLLPKNKKGWIQVDGHPAGEDMICTKEKNDQGQPSIGDFGDPLMYWDPIAKEFVLLGVYSYRWGRKSELAYSYVPHHYNIIHLMMKELKENIKH